MENFGIIRIQESGIPIVGGMVYKIGYYATVLSIFTSSLLRV